MSTWTALHADTYRLYKRSGWHLTLKGAVGSRPFRAIVTMRLCQAARDADAPWKYLLPLCKLLHRSATRRAGIDFSWQTHVGPGFALTHGWGTVISPGAVIGSNVTLLHGATLGRRDRITAPDQRSSAYPTLEDGVWIGPHAIITGAITIGQGSRVAGGTVVVADVPPASIVAGNPGKIIASDCVPDVMNAAPLATSASQPR
ncbi:MULTISPECIES: serine acetyltransferase [unclassified Janthinobacterium]|uniref:serine O-acetyltransferase n=1 Tax=unclassified Janthinobacterium TaxID=2610881 RepID=UPI00247686F0|nr:serine acetyltransferase [Janthinobacterium sp. CG_23.4]MDH6156918.1 serine O-acetyltransferase [Janthinobacterium sp. CG_23.4]